MLSILIPIYNHNALPLVKELQKQCILNGIVYEIICQDDASKSPLNKINEEINSLDNCFFISLENNVAHRQNRNLLAKKANFKWLLFIDGDSKIIQSNYIQTYLNNCIGFDVIYGGRQHPETFPSKQQKLRWKYGKYIEDKIASKRILSPFKSLLFNNTLIKKIIFDQVEFDKEIKFYGHDDTQFSYELSKLNVIINHIDNPILHEDIDDNDCYLKKAEESLKSVLILYYSKKLDSNFVSILKLYVFLKKTKLIFPVQLFFILSKSLLKKQVLSNNPSLFLFNLYRIGYISTLKIGL
ncbi:hypothetical protein SY27_00280 [Flavobacterium sp. 316]|uniref:glycosyltransferase family 2 protein n=1 Tax=Flavobacterium sp. 316 TaxID=1603293 RepID=UPI0005E230A8|nr:glycosyltransferase family 2 protein [Flavobacterium sp. 316]KIX22335.1 hypothetical protein SY27_00280 [Flavobacterium sp. 316]